MNAESFSPSLLLVASLAAVLIMAAVGAVLFRTLGLARDRYEVDSGLAQLAAISWHELQVLIGLGLRGRGLGAVGSGDHDDAKGGASDLLLSDGSGLQLLRVKHGGGIQVDDHTIFDLATRRDARRASGALLATTGTISRIGEVAAKDAGIKLISGAELWSLVSEHLPPRLRERIANRRRTTLRNRLGILIGSVAFSGVLTLALVYHLARAELIFASPSVAETARSTAAPSAPPPDGVTPDATAETVAEAPAAAPRPAPATAPSSPRVARAPLDEAELQSRRRDSAQSVRAIGEVFSARWSTASTLEVELRPTADLQDNSMFDRVCAILADSDELRFTRVQLQLKDADPTKGQTARWRQCQ